MTPRPFKSWPGESNTREQEWNNHTVEMPEVCPMCDREYDGRYPEHIRNDCRGKGALR